MTTMDQQPVEAEASHDTKPVSGETGFGETGFSEAHFTPLVVVSETENLDKSLIPRTTTTRGVKPTSPSPPGVKPTSPLPDPDRDKLLEWLADARLDAPVDVAASHVREAVAKIVRRPEWEDEMDAMLDHAEKSGLGPGWVVTQLRKYADVSPNSKLGFTWASGKPKGDYHAAAD